MPPVAAALASTTSGVAVPAHASIERHATGRVLPAVERCRDQARCRALHRQRALHPLPADVL